MLMLSTQLNIIEMDINKTDTLGLTKSAHYYIKARPLSVKHEFRTFFK